MWKKKTRKKIGPRTYIILLLIDFNISYMSAKIWEKISEPIKSQLLGNNLSINQSINQSFNYSERSGTYRIVFIFCQIHYCFRQNQSTYTNHYLFQAIWQNHFFLFCSEMPINQTICPLIQTYCKFSHHEKRLLFPS